METPREPSQIVDGEPIWVLTTPLTLVRFNPGDEKGSEAKYNEIGAIYLIGNVDAQRLRSVNLNRLAFIHPLHTLLPRWPGVEPPSEAVAASSTIDLEAVASDLDDRDSPGHGVFDDALETVSSLFEPWSRGEMNETGAVAFLRTLQSAHLHPTITEEWEIATAYGLVLIAPVSASPVKTLAAAIQQTPNYARQIIHRLRMKGLLSPALIERGSS